MLTSPLYVILLLIYLKIGDKVTKTDTSKLLSYILEILEMMVESGAEIYRVEESAVRICKAYGIGRADIFATTSNIIISVESFDGVIKTHTRRIGQINTNIEKVHALNNLVRKMTSEQPELTQIAAEINKINEIPTYKSWVIFIFYAIVAGSFYLFFGGRNVIEFLISATIGLFVGIINNLFGKLNANKLLTRFICSLFACSVAIICKNTGIILNGDFIIIGNIMTLIPGVGLTNALRDLFAGDSISGVLRLIEAALLALAIACGYIVAVFIFGGVAF